MKESEIVAAVRKHCAVLGYPNAVSVKEAQLGPGSGNVDLLLIPQHDVAPRLVLVEAKRRASDDANNANVVGQILRYYASARDWGDAGVQFVCGRAVANAEKWEAKEGVSVALLTGYEDRDEKYAALQRGTRLKPEEVELIIALDYWDHRIAKRLGRTVVAVRDHQIRIRIVTVSPDGVVAEVAEDRLVSTLPD